MPRPKDGLKVEVSEATADETRTITITIQTVAQDFLLADLLRQRGAVGGVEALLKPAAKEAIQKYLDSVEDLIAGVKKAGANGKAKPKPTSAEGGSQVEPSHAPEQSASAPASA